MLVDVVLLPCVAVNVRVCDFAVSKSVAVAEVEIAPVLELTANKPASLPAVMLYVGEPPSLSMLLTV